MDWQALLTSALTVAGGGVAGFLAYLVQRPKARADAVASLTDSALRQVNELQERTAAAEREAAAARDELAEARRQIRLLTDEVDELLAKLRAWRTAILESGEVPESIRQMVLGDAGQVNGYQL